MLKKLRLNKTHKKVVFGIFLLLVISLAVYINSQERARYYGAWDIDPIEVLKDALKVDKYIDIATVPIDGGYGSYRIGTSFYRTYTSNEYSIQKAVIAADEKLKTLGWEVLPPGYWGSDFYSQAYAYQGDKSKILYIRIERMIDQEKLLKDDEIFKAGGTPEGGRKQILVDGKNAFTLNVIRIVPRQGFFEF